MKISAFTQGKHAYHLGKELSNNPYMKQENDYTLWDTGFKMEKEIWDKKEKEFKRH